MSNETFRMYTCKAEFDKALFTLKGILEGILIDDEINHDEVMELLNWLSVNEALEKYKPFDEIIESLNSILDDGYIDEEEKEDLIWLSGQFSEHGKYYDIITRSVQTLQGICHGILADNQIKDAEVAGIISWIDDHAFLEGTYPYDELRTLLNSILADMVITSDELNKLKAFLGEFVDCTVSYNVSQAEIDELRSLYNVGGLCALHPNIIIAEHSFCFTGESSRASRGEMEQLVIEQGGRTVKNVSGKTDYLVIGDYGSDAWVFACYGRKVEKALEIRRNGGKVVILNESDFWDAVSGCI